MRARYDTAIPLSNLLTSEGLIDTETENRINRAIAFYKTGVAATISMCGGDIQRYHGNSIGITHAEAMKRYAIENDVPEKDIYCEEESQETVGQAVFSKLRIVKPKGWQKVLVITSNYHVYRASIIFDFIYGNGFDIDFLTIISPEFDTPEIRQKNRDSLKAFYRTFEGVKRGDDDEILKRLYSAHPRYRHLSGL
jgi:vancomycin permeability regulator SanA